jgi:broad specificity phosphatase PhoE
MFEPLPGSRMRRRIYLMRHGEVSYFDAKGHQVDADMVNLTADGRAQAAAMGEFLAEVPFDAVYCTGLPRTEQTARGAMGSRDMEIQIRPQLREISAGDMSGMSKEEVKRDFIHVFARLGEPGLVYGRGDVIEEFADRVIGDIAKLALEPGWTTILIAAHEVTNRCVLSWAANADLGCMTGFEQDPGCLNIIDIDIDQRGEKPEISRRFIKAMNLTPTNFSKLDNNLSTNEQIFALRKKQMGAA